MCQRRSAATQTAVETKVADSLNHSRENKTKGQDQRCAIVGSAKPHQGVRRIAKTEECPADFKIKIRLRCAREIRSAQIENRSDVDQNQRRNGCNRCNGRTLPENTDDFGPISHEFPQMPKKTGQTRRNAR